MSTLKNASIDLDGILCLVEALSMERQCIISLLKHAKDMNLTSFIDFVLKIQCEQTSIVIALKHSFENELNSIDSLKEINKILDDERNNLMNFLNGDIINNMTTYQHENNHKCYDLMTKRIVIIKNLIDHDIYTKTANNINLNHDSKQVDDIDNDVEIEIISSSQSLKCALTQSIMKYPKQSTKCKHIFECDAIIDYIINKETNIYYFDDIQCPICSQQISINHLITDYQMMHLLKNQAIIDRKPKSKIIHIDLTEDET